MTRVEVIMSGGEGGGVRGHRLEGQVAGGQGGSCRMAGGGADSEGTSAPYATGDKKGCIEAPFISIVGIRPALIMAAT